jgi:hypothetical protein
MNINARMDTAAAMIALRDELQAMTLQFRELRRKRSLRAVERAEQQLLAAKLKAAALAQRPVLSPDTPRSR